MLSTKTAIDGQIVEGITSTKSNQLIVLTLDKSTQTNHSVYILSEDFQNFAIFTKDLPIKDEAGVIYRYVLADTGKLVVFTEGNTQSI